MIKFTVLREKFLILSKITQNLVKIHYFALIITVMLFFNFIFLHEYQVKSWGKVFPKENRVLSRLSNQHSSMMPEVTLFLN